MIRISTGFLHITKLLDNFKNGLKRLLKQTNQPYRRFKPMAAMADEQTLAAAKLADSQLKWHIL